MAKTKHNRLGAEYQPVKALDILRALKDGAKSAHDLGEELWPHLIGRGSTRGGPSGCNYTASCQLGRLKKKGWVDQYTYIVGECRNDWYLTGEGHEELENQEQDSGDQTD